MTPLPADFPPPPAENARLAAVITWIFEVLRWLVARAAARAAAGLDGGGGFEPEQFAFPRPAGWENRDRSEPPGSNAGDGASPRAPDPEWPGPVAGSTRSCGPAEPAGDAAPAHATGPAEAPRPRQAVPPTAFKPRRYRHLATHARGRTSSAEARCAGWWPPPIAGPIQKSRAWALSPSHADIVTISKRSLRSAGQAWPAASDSSRGSILRVASARRHLVSCSASNRMLISAGAVSQELACISRSSWPGPQPA